MKKLLRKLRKSKSNYKYLLFLPGLLLLILPGIRPTSLPLFFSFLGRLHPLVLHFPIVLCVLVLLVEMSRQLRWVKINNRVMLVILTVTSLSTLISIGAGYFLFLSGDYSGTLPEQHLWAACITGVFIFSTTAFQILYNKKDFFKRAFIVGLILSNLAIVYASHLGGSITHGQDYLTEHFMLMGNTPETFTAKDESEMRIYDDMLVPIFENKCLGCHNPLKAKGKLVMTAYEGLFKSGESDTLPITPKIPEKSEIYKRITLPPNHPDHMPPDGKTPMTDSEISLLKSWILTGASRELKLIEAGNDMQPIIQGLMGSIVKYRTKAEASFFKRRKLRTELAQVAAELGVIIKPDSTEDSNLFILTMKFPALGFGNDQLKSLRPYFEVFSKVSLTSSQIDEEAMYYLSQMTNLKKLFVQKTRADGSGLVFFQKHRNLEILNLSYTFVDNKAALDLLKIPNLKEVYLFKTKVSKDVIETLRQYKPELKILAEEGPYN